MLDNDLLKKSNWTLVSGIGYLIIQCIIYYLAAQYFDSTELGSFFIATTLIFIPLGIIEYGFGHSIISKEEIDAQDLAATKSMMLLAGVLIAGLAWCVAFFYGRYYAIPDLVYYYQSLVPILFLASFVLIQFSYLKRKLEIKRYALVDLISNLVMLCLFVLCLKSGIGIYALIVGMLVKYLCAFICLLIIGGSAFLSLTFNPAYLIKPWQEGKYVMGEKAFGNILSYSDVFLINHFFGAGMVGIYDLFKRIIFRPLIVAYTAIENVFFPIISLKLRTGESLNLAYIKFLRLSMLALSLFILVINRDFILSFLPAEYQSHGWIFTLLIIYGTSLVILGPIDVLAYVLNQKKRFFRFAVLLGIFQLALMFVSIRFSVEALLASLILFNLLSYFLHFYILTDLAKMINLSVWLMPLIIWTILIATVLIALNLQLAPMLATAILLIVFLVSYRVFLKNVAA